MEIPAQEGARQKGVPSPWITFVSKHDQFSTIDAVVGEDAVQRLAINAATKVLRKFCALDDRLAIRYFSE
jgi:hypothetical protein